MFIFKDGVARGFHLFFATVFYIIYFIYECVTNTKYFDQVSHGKPITYRLKIKKKFRKKIHQKKFSPKIFTKKKFHQKQISPKKNSPKKSFHQKKNVSPKISPTIILQIVAGAGLTDAEEKAFRSRTCALVFAAINCVLLCVATFWICPRRNPVEAEEAAEEPAE